MKLSTSRDTLLSQLQTVTRAASTRSALQALSGVQVLATSDGVELRATDMELGLLTVDELARQPRPRRPDGAALTRGAQETGLAAQHRAAQPEGHLVEAPALERPGVSGTWR